MTSSLRIVALEIVLYTAKPSEIRRPVKMKVCLVCFFLSAKSPMCHECLQSIGVGLPADISSPVDVISLPYLFIKSTIARATGFEAMKYLTSLSIVL